MEEGGRYRISRSVRDVCVFARHNLVAESPFSRMDLISCRNLFIFLDADMQKRILLTLHYALKPEGVLFLGASETIGAQTDLFEPIDKKQRIYRHQANSIRKLPRYFSPRHPAAKQTGPVTFAPAGGLSGELSAQREADRLLLHHYAPPAVLLDTHFKIIQFRGATAAYLASTTSKVGFPVLTMARAGLVAPLRTALSRARQHQQPVRRKNITVSSGPGAKRPFTLVVTPLENLSHRCYLVSFEDEALVASARTRWPDNPHPCRKSSKSGASPTGAQIGGSREYAQSRQEQHEAVRAEIQASSEELQSINEELESTNKELITVNEEMVLRNKEQGRLNSDLQNLYTSSNTAIVVVGRDLTIWRFTTPAEKLFNLLPTDLGRSIRRIRHNIDIPRLEALIDGVLSHGVMQESEVQGDDGHWYLLRIRPYLAADGKYRCRPLAGRHPLPQAGRTGNSGGARLREPRCARHAIRCWSCCRLRVKTANEAFYRVFHTNAGQTEGRLFQKLGAGQWSSRSCRICCGA